MIPACGIVKLCFILQEYRNPISNHLTVWLTGIENLAVGNRPVLGGERYLTDKEVSAQLKLSRRVLQDYRNEGRIFFYLHLLLHLKR